MRDTLAPIPILDEATSVLPRVASPWLGVYWLLALPCRFLQVRFIDDLLVLGRTAGRYGDHLRGLSLAVFAALVPALYGRLLLVRAMDSHLAGAPRSGVRALWVGLVPFASYLYLALLLATVSCALVFTGFVPLLAIPLAGIAPAVALAQERVGLLRPVADLVRPAVAIRAIGGIYAMLALAFLLAAVNLLLLFQIGLWLSSGWGADLTAWAAILFPTNRLFALLLIAGSLLVVEPFWLAASLVLVRRFRERESGEDLRAWLSRIRAGAIRA
ncbi:MAG: hypothetical protein HY720_23265 [Planctomycetes bacterium]|nr:hypothetical protein [Planctomycetota bacterium]